MRAGAAPTVSERERAESARRTDAGGGTHVLKAKREKKQVFRCSSMWLFTYPKGGLRTGFAMNSDSEGCWDFS